MNLQHIKIVLIAIFTLSIAACELGNSPSASNNPAINNEPGFISSGTISGFGSIFVNGVEFDTSSATFDVDGNSGTQDDLDIGMIVQVTGTFNDDDTTGIASNVRYDDDLQGPIDAPITAVDANTKTFSILGINIIIDSSTTFDVSSDVTLPGGSSFGFDSIAVNNNVEISGFLDSSGSLNATRVELKNIDFDTNSIVEIKGAITGLANNTFKLVSLSLDIDASSAALDGMASGLQNDMFVEIKGPLNDSRDTLIANKVELENNFIDVSGKIEIEGIITDYVDNSNFLINGISVNASDATLEPDTLALGNDIRVEIEATIGINTLIVTKIKSKENIL